MQADPNKRPSVAEALRHPWLNQQLLSSDETPSQSIERISAEDGDDRRALQPSSLTHLPTLSHHRGDDALCRRLTEKGLDALDQEP